MVSQTVIIPRFGGFVDPLPPVIPRILRDQPYAKWEMHPNHYDRLVHFAFGLLLAYPAYELVLGRAKARHGWALVLATSTIVGMSGFFESPRIMGGTMVSPELGTAYLGTQGDQWDAQKDTTMAIIGALISLGLTSLVSRPNG